MEAGADQSEKRQTRILWLVLMLLATIATYYPSGTLAGRSLLGGDFTRLHERRMRFAEHWLFSRESVTAHSPILPAWYSRELLGTPFWANLQNFPWIPNRLILLFIDPEWAMTVGVLLAACLSALSMWLYARTLGMNSPAAALAGWTFATAGFFASRIYAGHLPLLEAYPALPLLLWLIEKSILQTNAKWLIALSIGVAWVCLAGHPQLPIYALISAGIYALYRTRSRNSAAIRWRICLAMILGVGLAAFALLPFAMMVARSTRVLALEAPYNDISLAPWRLGSLFYPWADGWPAEWNGNASHPFPGSSNAFWDTIDYMGLLPWLAALFLLIPAIRRRQMPRPALFFVLLGMIGLVTALTPARRLTAMIPGTYLRSPSRQLYLTTFCLALASGAALQIFLNMAAKRGLIALAAILVAANAIDIARFDRNFLGTGLLNEMDDDQARILQAAGEDRVAIDFDLPIWLNRRVDDVGFFDSIMLARPYRTMLSLAGLPPTTNMQEFKGNGLSKDALRYLSVRYVLTIHARDDLPLAERWGGLKLYEVPAPLQRAIFYPAADVIYLPPEKIQERLRSGTSPGKVCMLAGSSATDLPADAKPHLVPCDWHRDGPDAVVIQAEAPARGVLRFNETDDKGWRLIVDGKPAEVVCVDDTFLGVWLDAGKHNVRFEYHTPGAVAGAIVSVFSVIMLVFVTLRGLTISVQSSDI